MTYKPDKSRIWKYQLEWGLDVQKGDIPKHAQFLSAQIQHGVVVLWFLVDTTQELVPSFFHFVFTGKELPPGPHRFRGTFINPVNQLVYHLFEVL